MNGLDIALLCSIVFAMGFACGVMVVSHKKKWIPKQDIEEVSQYDDVLFEEKESKWERFKKGFGNLFIL